MGIHSERDRRVRMAQAFTDRYHICAIGDCKACACVTELVRVKIIHTVLLPETLKVACRALRVHHIRASFFREHKLTDCLFGLVRPELMQKVQSIRADINPADLLVLGGRSVDARMRGVLCVLADGDGRFPLVDVLPLNRRGLTTPEPGVSDKVDICSPL